MKSGLLFPLVLLLLSLSLQACAGIPTQPVQAPEVSSLATKAEPSVLRVGAPGDDYFFDPKDPGRVTVGMGFVNTNIFETLTRMDSDFQLQPMLAESWVYLEEDNAWRFHLRRDVTFHDSQSFTAKAVVETMNRITLNDSLAGILKINPNSAVIIDDYTVEIRPTTTSLQLAEQLSHPIFSIRAPGSDPFKGEHVGTGPFKFLEYVQDDHITVQANSDYWAGEPLVERIEFRFIPDPAARLSALHQHQVDLIYSVPLDVAEPLSSASDLRVLPANVGAYQGLVLLLSGEKPYDLTQDPLIRAAIGYAINRQAIIDTAFYGFATSSQTLIPEGVLGPFADRVEGYTHNPELAVTLLEEAGWRDTDGDGIREKNGRQMKLELISGFPNRTANRQTPEIIQAQLRDVGIEISLIELPDIPTYEQRLTEKQGDLWLEIGNQNSVSPCFLPSYLYYGKETLPNIWQLAFAPGPAGWPAFDDEIDHCTAASDPDEAAGYAANAMHILIDEARVVIPLVGLYDIWFTADSLRGFSPHPIPVMVRWNSVSINR